MELIRKAIDFVATGLGGFAAALAPYAFIGLLGLYLLWLVIGYLRVSQVGIDAQSATLPAATRLGWRTRRAAWRPLLHQRWPALSPRCALLHPVRGRSAGLVRELRCNHSRRRRVLLPMRHPRHAGDRIRLSAAA